MEVRKLDIYDEQAVNGSFCVTKCQVPNAGTVYVRRVRSQMLFSFGTYDSFLASRSGQKSSVNCMLLCQ